MSENSNKPLKFIHFPKTHHAYISDPVNQTDNLEELNDIIPYEDKIMNKDWSEFK